MAFFIEIDRLSIRPWEPEDEGGFRQMVSDPVRFERWATARDLGLASPDVGLVLYAIEK